MVLKGGCWATFFDPTRHGRARDAEGACQAAQTVAFLIPVQDLVAASLPLGVGSRVLAALTSAGTVALQLFAIGGMTIADQRIALTARAVKGDRHH